MEKLQNPLKMNLTNVRVNRTLHGRSKYRPVNVSGHNVVTGWYLNMDRDGIDWCVPSGTPVYASHDGVAGIRERNGILACVIIIGTGSDSIYRSVYAHLSIKSDLKSGDKVKQGQCIGYVGKKLNDPHLHYELWKNGQGICAKTPAGLSAKLATFFE